MAKPIPFDYLKLVLGIISAFSTVVLPIAIAWLVKNFKALKKSNEQNVEMKKHLAEEAKSQYNKNVEFNNSLQTQINNAVNNLNSELDRRTGLSNYETDRNRKGIDNLCGKLMTSADRFDAKVKDATSRMKSEMITKATYYMETAKLKDDFLRDILMAKSGLSDIKCTPANTNLTKDLRSINKKIEHLKTRLDNERIADNKKHHLTRRLLSAGLSERKELQIKHNNLKAEIKKYHLKTDSKLDNYNKLLTSLKGKVDKNKV